MVIDKHVCKEFCFNRFNRLNLRNLPMQKAKYRTSTDCLCDKGHTHEYMNWFGVCTLHCIDVFDQSYIRCLLPNVPLQRSAISHLKRWCRYSGIGHSLYNQMWLSEFNSLFKCWRLFAKKLECHVSSQNSNDMFVLIRSWSHDLNGTIYYKLYIVIVYTCCINLSISQVFLKTMN